MHEMFPIPHLSDQSLEWNDEPTDEQGGTESPPVVTDDVSAQNSERKEDNLVGTEENEWDKLLRIRITDVIKKLEISKRKKLE
ncbi:Protein chromatin remodeling 4 [Vitis vinifera]|uniref:Protein chromatin remodeling 4 n=1 Tax=Vitis vinifera TaxID=29760 RepID=A0A438J1D1_VITVI|nr:Protein chromatin remodeling 4 [Vitis vinifera]